MINTQQVGVVGHSQFKANATLGNNNAGFHNSIYRGKKLGTAVSADQFTAIGDGSFDGMFIGDYWEITYNNVARIFRIAAFDYWLHNGDTECTTHHVLIVPDDKLCEAKMNNSNITTGGYVGSDFYTGNNSNTGKSDALAIVNGSFGSGHILEHKNLLSNAVASGVASGWAWYASKLELMSESMVYGSPVAGARKADDTNFNIGIDNSQLPLFAYDHSRICNRGSWWLRDVVSSTGFARVDASGVANGSYASYSHGIRPAFAIIA